MKTTNKNKPVSTRIVGSTKTTPIRNAKKKPRKGGKCETSPNIKSLVKNIVTAGSSTPQSTYLTLLSKLGKRPTTTTLSEFFRNYRKFPSYRTVEQEFYNSRKTIS